MANALSKDLTLAARDGAVAALDVVAVIAVSLVLAIVAKRTGGTCALRVDLPNQRRT